MHIKPMGRTLTCTLFAVLLCLWAVQGHTSEAYCQKKAESLGWAVGCGCLKHDLSRVQENILLLLPECSEFRLANSVANGLEESANHDEYHFLCMIACRSTDWRGINDLVGGEDGRPI
jgi:hypothetical protein